MLSKETIERCLIVFVAMAIGLSGMVAVAQQSEMTNDTVRMLLRYGDGCPLDANYTFSYEPLDTVFSDTVLDGYLLHCRVLVPFGVYISRGRTLRENEAVFEGIATFRYMNDGEKVTVWKGDYLFSYGEVFDRKRAANVVWFARRVNGREEIANAKQ